MDWGLQEKKERNTKKGSILKLQAWPPFHPKQARDSVGGAAYDWQALSAQVVALRQTEAKGCQHCLLRAILVWGLGATDNLTLQLPCKRAHREGDTG